MVEKPPVLDPGGGPARVRRRGAQQLAEGPEWHPLPKDGFMMARDIIAQSGQRAETGDGKSCIDAPGVAE